MTELSIKIKNNLAERIYKISKKSKRNFTYHINKALENYIEEQSDLEEAHKRLNNKNDPVISSKELRRSLGL